MWNANKIGYMGNTAYNRAYQGDELVWEKRSKIPNNEIWYTSTNNTVVLPYINPYRPDYLIFGANIVSNTYINGQGIITFNGDVTLIGQNAFLIVDYYVDASARKNLTSIIIPDKVTEIGKSAFGNLYPYAIQSSLSNIYIGENVTIIGDYAFEHLENLTNINIPDKVTEIGLYAFSVCKALPKIIIPKSIVRIKEGAFSNCYALTNIQYEGTISEWNAVIKYGGWHAHSPATAVHCADGDVNI